MIPAVVHRDVHVTVYRHPNKAANITTDRLTAKWQALFSKTDSTAP